MNIRITFLSVLLMLLLVGCGKVKEKDLVGAWESEQKIDGVKGMMQLIFDEDGSFVQACIPLENNSCGFSVEGDWKIDAFGSLKLNYDMSSLDIIKTPDFIDPYGNVEEKLFRKLKRQIREFNQSGDVYKIELSKNGKKLFLTTKDGKDTYKYVEEEDLTTLNTKNGKQSSRDYVFGGSIPTSGNINVFSALSDNYLSASDLRNYSSSELRILRNAIYAMHDYDFDSPDLRDFFGNFSGYAPLTKNPHLSKIENANVNLIKSYE